MSGRGRQGGGRGGGGRNQGGRGRGFGGRNSSNQGRGRGGLGGRNGGRSGGDRQVGRGPGGRGPDLSSTKSLLSNILLATVSPNFSFWLYSIECKDRNNSPIDGLSRRGALFNQALWKTLLKDKPKKEKEDLERVVFFSGSFFYSARPIEGLEATNLPREILDGSESDGDSFAVQKVWQYTAPKILEESVDVPAGNLVLDNRCSNCVKAFPDVRGLLQHCAETGHKPVFDPKDGITREAEPPVFLSYANMVLSRALSERLAKWGREFINPDKFTDAVDRRGKPLGVTIFQAFSCEFGLVSPKGPSKAHLALTVDLRAKLLRSQSLLDSLYDGKDPNTYTLSRQEQDRAKRQWVGETVIYKIDKKTYSIVDLKFDQSASSLPVDGLMINGKSCSHAQYFKDRKNISLKYPNACPMVEVLGRRKQNIFLPAELICGNELDRRVKEMLPTIASYTPEQRNAAIEVISRFLQAGAQKTRGAGGLLPACGIVLREDRLQAKCTVMPVPMLMAAGVTISQRNAENWAPALGKAKFNVEPSSAVRLNVVVFHSRKLRGAKEVYGRIRNFVNEFKTAYQFNDSPIDMIETDEQERHWGAVERYFSGGKRHDNVFVLDFTQPRGSLDPAYPVVKQMLTKAGYLSQFVNFCSHNHSSARDAKDTKRSNIILQGVARQILQKAGIRLWWVALPKSLPLPAVFVGVDVFHAPRVYDPVKKARVAKASCAAIIVQVVRPGAEKRHKVEIYSETFARAAGEEYGLQDALSKAISNALTILNVNPMCCVVWRDGIGDSAFDTLAGEEIAGIRQGLAGGQALVGSAAQQQQVNAVPLSYIVAQKRIATKFVTKDGKYGAPPGTLVEGIQGLKYDTFYIQGRAPPFSTPKPVRFVVVEQDDQLQKVRLPELTWAMCHDYPNWPGPIKVPSVCMHAHKLAELGGGFANCGSSIDHKAFANTVHFL